MVLNELTRYLVASQSIPETMRKSAGSSVPKFLFKVGDVVADVTHDYETYGPSYRAVRRFSTSSAASCNRRTGHPSRSDSSAMWDVVSHMPLKGKMLRPQEAAVTRIDHGTRQSGGPGEICVCQTRCLLL